jgi:hypothetical protein
MVLEDKTGIDGENFAVDVELDTVASSHVALACQVGNELILEVADCNEGGRVVRNKVLAIDRSFEYSPLLSNAILRVRHN